VKEGLLTEEEALWILDLCHLTQPQIKDAAGLLWMWGDNLCQAQLAKCLKPFGGE